MIVFHTCTITSTKINVSLKCLLVVFRQKYDKKTKYEAGTFKCSNVLYNLHIIDSIQGTHHQYIAICFKLYEH